MSAEYSPGDELGDLGLYFMDTNGALIDFSTGYTFVVTILDGDGNVLVTKSDDITGAAGSLTTNPPTPNVTIAWDTTGELDQITTPGSYPFRCVATRTADSKNRTFRGVITRLAP